VKSFDRYALNVFLSPYCISSFLEKPLVFTIKNTYAIIYQLTYLRSTTRKWDKKS
jgi:hypothetical protein